MQRRSFGWTAALILAVGACSSSPPRGVLGAYRLPDGRVVSIRPSVDRTLRYREYATGHSGRLYRVGELRYESGPGFTEREPVTLTVDFQLDDSGIARTLAWNPTDGLPVEGRRIGRENWVRFESDGTTLVGRLHRPEAPGPHPGIVLVHGSGDSPGTDWLYNGDFLVAHGFAVLAYDKRGTGQSGGEFTFDFEVLARDAAVAVDFLRAQPGIDADQIGLSGYSQGGWVAPLAALMVPVRFVLVSYGMIESPAQEARLEMLHLLTEAGVDGNELSQADSLISAAVAVVASRFEEGWDEFGALKKRYSDAAWREHLLGTPVDRLMKYPKWLTKLFGSRELPRGLRWHYDSTALLEAYCVPMTWFLGTDDLSAPNQFTIPKLQAMGEAGMPYDLRLFEGADHSMLMFREEGDARVYTRYAPGYFQAEVEAARKWVDADPEAIRCH